jgi:hypothetical protein
VAIKEVGGGGGGGGGAGNATDDGHRLGHGGRTGGSSLSMKEKRRWRPVGGREGEGDGVTSYPYIGREHI